MPDIQDMMHDAQLEKAALQKEEGICALKLDEKQRQASGLSAGHLAEGPFLKLKRFLAQIVGLQAKEADLLGQIEKIERTHAELKRRHLLHRAEVSPDKKEPPSEEKPTRKRKGLTLWQVLGFLAFFDNSSSKKDDPKPR